MGDVERKFVVDVAAVVAFLHGAVDVDNQVAAELGGFAGNGVVAEADDVGRAVLSEIFVVGLGDAPVVNQNNGDFAPSVGGGFGFQFPSEPVSQLLELSGLDRMVFLPVDQGCFHGLWGTGCGRGACW